jgi:hypothetical protein
MDEFVQPNAWVALRLPPGNSKVVQVAPNTFVSASYSVGQLSLLRLGC